MNEMIDLMMKTKTEIISVAKDLQKTRKDINGISFLLGCTMTLAYVAYKKVKKLENEIKEIRKEK